MDVTLQRSDSRPSQQIHSESPPIPGEGKREIESRRDRFQGIKRIPNRAGLYAGRYLDRLTI